MKKHVLNFLSFGLLIFIAPVTAFADGGSIYQEKCAACHGPTGQAVLPGAPHFNKGERFEKADGALKGSVLNGLNVMPPFKGALSDAQAAEVIAFIRTLKK